MTFKISVQSPTKSGPKLCEMTKIVADAFRVVNQYPDSRIEFYSNVARLFRKPVEIPVAFLPGTGWVIETV